MTRLAGTGLSESQSSVISVAVLVKLAITGGTGTYNFTSWDGPVTLDGVTYQPTNFSVGGIEERDDSTVTMRSVTFSLSEQDLSSVLQTPGNFVGASMTLIDALIQSDGSAVATGTWTGILTSRKFNQGADAATITLTGMGWFSVLDKNGTVRFDDVSQQTRAAGDTFFANMPTLKGQTVIWMGKRAPTVVGGAPLHPPSWGNVGLTGLKQK